MFPTTLTNSCLIKTKLPSTDLRNYSGDTFVASFRSFFWLELVSATSHAINRSSLPQSPFYSSLIIRLLGKGALGFSIFLSLHGSKSEEIRYYN